MPTTMNFHSANKFLPRFTLIALLISLGFSSPLLAQETKWDEAPLDKNYKYLDDLGEDATRSEKDKIKSENRIIRDRIRDTEKQVSSFLEGVGPNPQNVDAFLNGYVFARMTKTDMGTLNSLGLLREEFYKDYLSDKVTGSARTTLIDQIAFPTLRSYVENEKFHPAVRHNALTIIANLDTTPGDRPTATLPIPSDNAMQYLATVFSGANYPDFLKVAALAGIQRHVEIDSVRGQLANNLKTSLYGQLMAIVEDRAAGSDQWQPSLKYWLKRRSVQCLGQLKQLGPNGETVDALRKLIATGDRAQLWIQFDALQALAALDLSNLPVEKSKGVAYEIAEFVAKSLEDEGTELFNLRTDLIKKNIIFADRDLALEGTEKTAEERKRGGLKAGGGGGGMEGAGGGGNQQQEEKEEETIKVEIANYHLNSSRSRAKVICHFVSEAFARNGNLAKAAAANNEDAFLVDFLQSLTDVIKNTDVGVTDIDEDEKTPGDKKRSYTLQLSEILIAASKDIRRQLPKDPAAADPTAQPLPGEAPAEPGTPAGDPAGAGN